MKVLGILIFLVLFIPGISQAKSSRTLLCEHVLKEILGVSYYETICSGSIFRYSFMDNRWRVESRAFGSYNTNNRQFDYEARIMLKYKL